MTFLDPAFKLSSKIIQGLINEWGPHDNRVLYSINLPVVERLLHEDGIKVYWTSAWKTNYKRMFTEVPRVVDSTLRTTDATVSHNGGGKSHDVGGGGS